MVRSERLKAIIRDARRRGYRVLKDGRAIGPRGELKTHLRAGYPAFGIRLSPEKVVPVPVHQLAAYQKFGEAMFADGVEVRHVDEDCLNTRPGNLVIGSRSDNEQDKPSPVRLAVALNAASKLRSFSYKEVARIRRDRAAGMKYSEIQRKYKMAKSTLSYIINRKTYRQRDEMRS